MKSGKFMRELILETRIGKLFSPSVLNWLSGDVFTQQWYTYTYGHTPEVFELHVDDDFRRIYSSSECRGDFGSCMTDRDRETFYRDAVKAKAAYITDEQGYVLARAVLFTDVTDQDGKNGGCWKGSIPPAAAMSSNGCSLTGCSGTDISTAIKS